MDGHVHSAGLTGLIILAWLIVWHFLIRVVSSHHASHPVAQAAANII